MTMISMKSQIFFDTIYHVPIGYGPNYCDRATLEVMWDPHDSHLAAWKSQGYFIQTKTLNLDHTHT